MTEMKVIDVDKMADVRSLSGQFYRKPEVDEVIATIKSERDEYRYNLSCARNEIHNMQIAMRDESNSITNKDKEIQRLEKLCENYRCDCDDLAIMTDKLKKAGRSLRQNMNHQKYKRCMAMAQVLEHVCPITNRKAKWRDKWHKRWLELAEKFKEA